VEGSAPIAARWWRPTDLLAAFAGFDALIAATALSVVGPGVLALIPIAAALGGFLLYATARTSRALRTAALCLLVTGLFLVPQAALILGRPPHAPVQDGLLITEAAAGRLVSGHDPYGHDYLDDAPLRAFYLPEIPVNPLLAHYVYPPAMIVSAVPFRLAGIDFAWAWLLALPLLALAAYRAAGAGGVIAVALNPLLLLDYFYLFNDLFFLAAGLAAVGALRRRTPVAAGALLGLALGLKQQALLLVPPLLYLGWRFLDGTGRRRAATAGAGVMLVLGLPFLAWSAPAFLSDTAAYFYGSGVDTYPIRGIGLPGWLLSLGVLPSRWAPYPAAPLQLLAVIPILVVAVWNLGRRFTWWRFWLWSTLLAIAVFGLGRTLAPNYVTLAVLLGALALTSALDRDLPGPPAIGRDHDRTSGHGGVDDAVHGGERRDLPPLEGRGRARLGEESLGGGDQPLQA
jgi:hypothetical protein